MNLVQHPVGQCQESGCEELGSHVVVVDHEGERVLALVCEAHAAEAAGQGSRLLMTPLGRPSGQERRAAAAFLRERAEDLPAEWSGAARTRAVTLLTTLAARVESN